MAITKKNEQIMLNWIANTHSSKEPGQHWVCILMHQIPANHQDKVANTIDSWGSQNSKKIFREIATTLKALRAKSRSERALGKCSCNFELVLPIVHQIQHFTYVNCGWYAMYFCQLNVNDLFDWVGEFANYGQIKQAYRIICHYFRLTFFSHSTYLSFADFKSNVESGEKPYKPNLWCKSLDCYL